MVSTVTKIEIVWKSYIPEKLLKQLTTLKFTKILVFHIIGSCLRSTIDEDMVYNLFSVMLLGDTFLMSLKQPKRRSSTSCLGYIIVEVMV